MAIARAIEIETPLGDDLLFLSMRGREELGRLYEYDVTVLSARNDIGPEKLLGQPVKIKLALPDGGDRLFAGHVTRFAQIGMRGRYHEYHLVLRPWLWFLTLRTDCRIFQDIAVKDIVATVLDDEPYKSLASRFTTHGAADTRDYCVQYRETDFDFVARLLEDEGMYFCYRDKGGDWDLTFFDDSVTQAEAYPGYDSLDFLLDRPAGGFSREGIFEWRFEAEVQSGSYAIADFDFKRPSVDLWEKADHAGGHAADAIPRYDYPDGVILRSRGDDAVALASSRATLRADGERARYGFAEGVSNARGLGVGHLFTLAGHPRRDQNGKYLVVGADYELNYADYEGLRDNTAADLPLFRVRFRAIDAGTRFVPPRRTAKPFVQGPQTAIVVGPDGDEIHTDRFGRVKVRFHWDREARAGKRRRLNREEAVKPENYSCWVRVSHPWAGKNWGMVAIPRIGQEVIVDFLEGDPDRPIVTGRVYNAEQMPPYDLPANMTQTGIKSRSTKSGGPANFNEIRFEDKKGSEQVYVHAERNLDTVVEADETREVGHDRKTHIGNDETLNVDANRTTHVKGDFKETVDGSETRTVTGSVTEKVDGGETRTINAGATETINAGETRTVTGGMKETISGGVTQTINGGETRTINGALTETISGALTQTVNGGITITTPGAFTITANGGYTVVAPGGTKVIDSFLSVLGGDLFETYGKKIKATPINLELNAFKAEHHGIKVDFGTCKTISAGMEMKKLGAKMMASDSAILEKAGLKLAKAGAFLIG